MEEVNKPEVPAKRRCLQLESQESNSKEHFPVVKAEEANATDDENILELLPDEVLMKIMDYLSTYDILRIIAQVSKKFRKISLDPFLIKSIKLRAQLEDLTEEEEEKLCGEFSNVVRRSQKLKFLSLNFIGWNERKFSAMFASINSHNSMEEFWLKYDGIMCEDFDLNFWHYDSWHYVLEFLQGCSSLKILKIDFDQCPRTMTNIGIVLQKFNNFTFNNLKVLDLKFSKNYRQQLQEITPWLFAHPATQENLRAMQPTILSFVCSVTKKLPKLESLRLSLWLEPRGMELWVMHHTLQYKFYNAVNQVATEKNIKIEIVDFYRQ